MKIKLFKSVFFFNFLISVLLTVTLIPLNLSNPEEDLFQRLGQYQDVSSDYSLYSTIRSLTRAGDYNDQYFSEDFILDCFQQRSFDSIILFTEQYVISKLLSYRLISLPPPLS